MTYHSLINRRMVSVDIKHLRTNNCWKISKKQFEVGNNNSALQQATSQHPGDDLFTCFKKINIKAPFYNNTDELLP